MSDGFVIRMRLSYVECVSSSICVVFVCTYCYKGQVAESSELFYLSSKARLGFLISDKDECK